MSIFGGASGLAAAEQAVTEPAAESIDWNKPVVSRGFGRADTIDDADAERKSQFRRGEIAYFFQNYQAAFQAWLPLAKAGQADAQANIGWLYQRGWGTNQNYQQAKIWYERAIEQKHAVAFNNLAVLYEQGWGVDKNPAQAFAYYRSSAELDYRYGQFNLGRSFLEGIGVARDLGQAQRWLTLAQAAGVGEATKLLMSISSK